MSQRKRKDKEREFEGKRPEDIEKEIQAIKEEMRSIKDRMECPGDSLEPKMNQSGLKELRICRERLSAAKEALRSAGVTGHQDSADARSQELLDNLPFFSTLTFEIGGYFGGYKTYIIEKADNSDHDGAITYRNEDYGISKIGKPGYTAVPSVDTVEKLIGWLKDMHIDEWMPDYRPERFGMSVMDGTQWSLKIDFDNGHAAWESCGNNSYPYNFRKLRTLLESQGCIRPRRS